MTKQQNLFDPAPKYQAHSDTSKAAAMEIESSAGTLRSKVLNYLRFCGDLGATDAEMQEGLRMNPSTQRPRRIELFEKGLIKRNGKMRKTPSGRHAAVWVIAGGEE